MSNQPPIYAQLERIGQSLANHNQIIVIAPPGSGKTTRIPLYLLDKIVGDKKIIMLEPRRLAARSSAQYMAKLLGEKVGERVGYLMRYEQCVSAKTRIFVITQGVYSRMVVDDPELSDIGIVIFDEFHERSQEADFGLSLTLQAQAAFRPDLAIIVMSATIDATSVATLLDQAPIIESQSQSYEVEIQYQPLNRALALADGLAQAIKMALATYEGSILVFLPGQAEITATKKRLDGLYGADIEILALYGALTSDEQQSAIAKPKAGHRKVVLATSIAESALTIEGVRIVIDSGLSRQPSYDGQLGLTHLQTVRASRASIAQRAGRAGREAPGIAIRLWHKNQTQALPPYDTPEITRTDLSRMMLDCAAFGITDMTTLTLLDPLPDFAIENAKRTLKKYGAIDDGGQITPLGQKLRELPLSIALSHMVLSTKAQFACYNGALLALMLSDTKSSAEVDLDKALNKLAHDHAPNARKMRALAQKLSGHKNFDSTVSAGSLLLTTFPAWVAKRRAQAGQFLCANGKGAYLDEGSWLGQKNYIVIADMIASQKSARILAAADIDEASIECQLKDHIWTKDIYAFDKESRSVKAKRHTMLGKLVLREQTLRALDHARINEVIIDQIKTQGLSVLNLEARSQNLLQRLNWLYKKFGAPWPNVAEEHLRQTAAQWLQPFLTGSAKLSDIDGASIHQALLYLLPQPCQKALDQLAPATIDLPRRAKIAIDYQGETPKIALAVQLLYGQASHPKIGGDVALLIDLLSPAKRLIQRTQDLENFWQGSWQDVRKDMKARYPKHDWPQDPRLAPHKNS